MTEIDHGDITNYVTVNTFNGGLPYEITNHSAELWPYIMEHSDEASHLIQQESRMEEWEFNQVLDEFFYSLRKMGDSLNMSFPVYNRAFVLMDEKDVLGDGDHKEKMVDLYGEELEDGAIGTRVFLPDGGFELRIGFKGKEADAEKAELLEVMAHEYGHTLGDEIQDPILEECKAYAFSYLFSGFVAQENEGIRFNFYTVDTVSKPDFLEKWEKRGAHERAKDLLASLQMNGKSRAQILADLTGSRFGNCTPQFR